MSEAKVYRVPSQNFEKLCQRLEKLTRRAKKLGRSVPILNKISEESETLKNGFVQVYYNLTIESERICVANWDFVASIDVAEDNEVGRVISRVPGMLSDIDLPANFRDTDTRCEHCNVNRRRNTVFVVRHHDSGDWKQIGRQCLGQFLGGVDPSDVVAYMETLIEFDGLCKGAEDSDFFGFGGQYDSLDLVSTLTLTGFVIKKLGWLSRSKARELAGHGRSVRATADVLMDAYFTQPAYQAQETKEVLEAFKTAPAEEKASLELQAEAAIDWIRTLPESEVNDYLWNLKVVCASSAFNRKHIGLACSLLIAHQNAMGRLESLKAEQAKRKVSEHFGVVGQRSNFDLLVRDIKYWPTNFGTTQAIFFEDVNGNRAIWKSSREIDVTVGKTYQVVGKVKNHSDFRGTKQTELSHCKILGAIGAF